MKRGRRVVAALVIALTGCQAGEPAAPEESPEPPTETRGPGTGGPPGPGVPPTARSPLRPPGTPTPSLHRARQQVCDEAGAGTALHLSTIDATGARVLDEWDACVRTDTTPDYTWLRNRTEAVWTLRTAPWGVVQEHQPAPTRLGAVQTGVFHRAAEERGKPPNAAAFILPGESVWIAAEPDTVTWHVDLPLSVTWSSSVEVLRRLDNHGQPLLTRSVTGRENAPSVAVTCVIEMATYARNRADLHDADLQDVIRDGFEHILADEGCSAAAEETVVGVRGRTISLREDVLEVIPGSQRTLERISGELEPYAEIDGSITLTTGAGGQESPSG